MNRQFMYLEYLLSAAVMIFQLSFLGHVVALSSSGSTPSLYDASADLFNIDGTIEQVLASSRLAPTHVGLVSLPLPGSLSPLLALSSHLVKEGHRVSVYTTDEAIDLLPVGTIKKQAVRECEREQFHWNGDRNMYKSFATFGMEDGGDSIADVGVESVPVDDNWQGDESGGLAGAYFCGCLLNFSSKSTRKKRDRAHERSLPGSVEASNACDMLETFGRSKSECTFCFGSIQFNHFLSTINHCPTSPPSPPSQPCTRHLEFSKRCCRLVASEPSLLTSLPLLSWS